MNKFLGNITPVSILIAVLVAAVFYWNKSEKRLNAFAETFSKEFRNKVMTGNFILGTY